MLRHLCGEIQVSQHLTGHTDAVLCVMQLADGRIVSGSDDGSLRVWDNVTGRCIQQLTDHTDGVECVIQLADGCIVSGNMDKSLRVWE